MPGVAKLVAPETPRWFQTMQTQESGPTAAYNKGIQSVLTGKPYPLRFIFAQSTNPMSATRQPKTVAEALKKLDYYVVMDVAWNSSCDYADIVLPAATQYESADQFSVNNGPEGTFIGINQVISEPVGECPQRLAVLPRSGRENGLRRRLLERRHRRHAQRAARRIGRDFGGAAREGLHLQGAHRRRHTDRARCTRITRTCSPRFHRARFSA